MAQTATGPLPGDKKMMPEEKSGHAFLANSHFSIAQDDSVTQNSFKSVFKRDYPPWEISSKPAASQPPRPASVLQTDDRYFNEKASETRQAYEYRKGDTDARDATAPHSTHATNFKMDSDPRLNSFETTHKRDYQPKEGGSLSRGTPKQNPMQSFIPQGDQEKAPEPISDYRDRYRGHDVMSAKPEKAQPEGGPPTILGDSRQHHFSTTHKETFRGNMLPKIPAIPAPTGCNIPQGDQDKEVTMATTHQVSFPKHDQIGSGYDRGSVSGKLQTTNFKHNDGHGTWNTYRSTMADSYIPLHSNLERPSKIRDRNHSEFPVGDDNPYRNSDRANLTTNRYSYGNPPRVERANIVSGASKRTQSQVVFGEPTLADQYYETTTDSTFKPVSVPYQFSRPDLNTRSAVPVDYYVNECNNTTYTDNFLDPQKDKMIPNPAAIETLKESHMQPPLGGQRWFSTEHLDQYTPKYQAKTQVGDPGRLQRSSVPIGTLQV